MSTAHELLKEAGVKIEEQAKLITEYDQKLTQYDDANTALAYELDLIKKAFALIEYGVEPGGFESYNEALEKAASFEEQHGTGALSLNKVASAYVVQESPSLGKMASAPSRSPRGLHATDQQFLNDMLSIVNQEE